jgi:hypothetical protein
MDFIMWLLSITFLGEPLGFYFIILFLGSCAFDLLYNAVRGYKGKEPKHWSDRAD